MHPIDDLAMPLLVVGAVLATLFMFGSLVWRRYRSHVDEGESFFEDVPAPNWTAEQLIAWRDYFAETRSDPAIDLRW